MRHLTYFIYPRGPWWRWNVEQLRERISLFNGRRLVTIATDRDSADHAEAADAFKGMDCELRLAANNPAGKELVGHIPMIEELARYRGESDCTFYGHAKGVSSHAYGEGVRRWIAAMYAALLDYWPAVRRELENHATVGIFRRIMSPPVASVSDWHYSGSFRWTRNADLYSRNWRLIAPDWYGPETYPGVQFRWDESACLFGEFAYAGVGLYVESTWASWATAAAEDWYAAHADDRLTPILVTCILTAHGQPELVHQAIRSVREQTADAWQLVILHSGACASAEAFDQYRGDARIELLPTGESPADSAARCGQGWAINEAWRRGRVRGELVLHLSDDDVYAPGCFAEWMSWAAAHPGESAWYGKADKGRLSAGGYYEPIGAMPLLGPGTPAASLRGHVDGLQVCVRRSAWTPWPEARELAPQADGHWMDALCRAAPILPAEVYVGTHRHTPRSSFTR